MLTSMSTSTKALSLILSTLTYIRISNCKSCYHSQGARAHIHITYKLNILINKTSHVQVIPANTNHFQRHLLFIVMQCFFSEKSHHWGLSIFSMISICLPTDSAFSQNKIDIEMPWKALRWTRQARWKRSKEGMSTMFCKGDGACGYVTPKKSTLNETKVSLPYVNHFAINIKWLDIFI